MPFFSRQLDFRQFDISSSLFDNSQDAFHPSILSIVCRGRVLLFCSFFFCLFFLVFFFFNPSFHRPMYGFHDRLFGPCLLVWGLRVPPTTGSRGLPPILSCKSLQTRRLSWASCRMLFHAFCLERERSTRRKDDVVQTKRLAEEKKKKTKKKRQRTKNIIKIPEKRQKTNPHMHAPVLSFFVSCLGSFVLLCCRHC